MFDPKKIVIHHSATVDGSTYSWHAIHNYHVRVRGWLDIGYHAGIEEVLGSYAVLYGRPLTVVGAHARGHNAEALGFCFVGNWDVRAPERARLEEAARRCLVPWCQIFSIHPDEIVPHSSLGNKTCPGTKFPMDRLREIVSGLLI